MVSPCKEHIAMEHDGKSNGHTEPFFIEPGADMGSAEDRELGTEAEQDMPIPNLSARIQEEVEECMRRRTPARPPFSKEAAGYLGIAALIVTLGATAYNIWGNTAADKQRMLDRVESLEKGQTAAADIHLTITLEGGQNVKIKGASAQKSTIYVPVAPNLKQEKYAGDDSFRNSTK